MRTTVLLLVLAMPSLAGDDLDTLVDQLFSKDANQRTEARKALLASKDADLEQILARIEARRPAEATLTIYDVSDLRGDPKNWAATHKIIKSTADGAKSFQYDAERGVLIVSASEGVHAKIAERVNALRRAQGTLVQIHAWFVKTKKPAADLPTEIATGDLKALIESIDGEVLLAPALTCFNGDRATMEFVEGVSFVEDFDIDFEITNGAVAFDPVIGTAQSGLTLEVRPVVTKDGAVQLATTVRRTTLDLPFPTLKVPTITGQKAEIQIPTLRTEALITLKTCKLNRVIVLDLGDGIIVLLSAKAVEFLDENDVAKRIADGPGAPLK